MALRSLDRMGCMRLLQQVMKAQGARASSATAINHNDPYIRIGKREVVGFGYNGGLNYADRGDFPMPAIRFKEIDNEIATLKEKEKGDWKKLTIEEKKALYRASFCQTFEEMHANTGEWKIYISSLFIACSLACWIFMSLRAYVLPPLPGTFTPEAQQAQLKNMIDLYVNPIEGVASKYDYEKGRWK
uniref:Cytochrome c oxidase subunit 4 n=1 Tax=Hirondellea gigas TaxID=1518452 RepID=A0A6A7FNY9_9CRUS